MTTGNHELQTRALGALAGDEQLPAKPAWLANEIADQEPGYVPNMLE